MNRLRATTTTVLTTAMIAAMIGGRGCETTTAATATAASAGDWLRAAALDGCRATVGWPQCVAQKVTRTLRLLEQSDDLRIAEGVHLIKNVKPTAEDDPKAE